MDKIKAENTLYSFTLNREIEKEFEEEREENGEKVTVKRKKKEKEPVTFYLKKPNRRDRDDADMFYAASFGKAVEAGLLPRALLDKKFKDSGGELNKKDQEQFSELLSKLIDEEGEIARLSVERKKNKERINELSKSVVLTRKQLTNFQMYQTSLYKDTADSKAESRVIVWLLLHLMYWRQNESDDILPFFEGKTYEEKLESYDFIVDGEDEISQEAISKMLTMISLLWMGVAKSREDFEKYEKQIAEEMAG